MESISLCTGYLSTTWSIHWQQNIFSVHLEKYSRDFEITGGHHLMESFIGLDVEQSKSNISLDLDTYIRKTRDITRSIRQRRRSDQSLRQFSWESPGICTWITRCTRNTRNEETRILSFNGSAASICSNMGQIWLILSFDSYAVGQLGVSVHRQDHRIWGHFIT